MDNTTATLLRQLAARYETAAFLDGDPSAVMHDVAGETNREVTAFVAACLSYGSRRQFLAKVHRLVDVAGGDMLAWVCSGAFLDAIPDSEESFYRMDTCRDVRTMLTALRAMLAQCGSIGNFVRQHADDALTAITALCRYFAAAGGTHLVPHDARSACKRLCMFMRWMVRSDSPVDLGLWSSFIDRRTLIMPLDVHVMQEAASLGLLASRSATMSTALRLTEEMRSAFPDDPLKGDFALFGLGIERQRQRENNGMKI